MIPLNDLGELTMMDGDGRMVTYPTYTCGHCSNVVVMRKDRLRDRTKCLPCGKWLCEDKAICREQCTPLYRLADDRFENAGVHGKLLGAIMAGATTVEEGHSLGLITTD